MTWRMKTILAAVAAAGMFVAGFVTAESVRGAAEIQIVEKTKTVTKWINRPQTDAECWKCLANPLELDGSIKNSILHAWASDGCRKAERDFILKAVAPFRKNIIQVGYSYSIRQVHEVDALYFRRLTERMALGGGPGISILNEKMYDAQIKVAGQYEF